MKINECETSNQVRPEKEPPGIGAMLNEVVRYYKREGRRSTEHIERHVARLKKGFAGKRSDEITCDRINRYKEKRQGQEASNATINRELAVLRLAYSLARKGKRITHDMCPEIEMLQEIDRTTGKTTRRTGYFEPEQYEGVLRHLPAYLQGVLTLGYWGGMRKEEILSLKWEQVDLAARELKLTQTKNGEDRTLALNDELYKMFERQWADRWDGCPYVFHHGPERISDFRKSWASACLSAGCSGKLFHDLRRTAVRNMIRGGVAQSIAMMISGHKDARIFERYNIVDTRDLKEALRKRALYEVELKASRSVLGSHTFTETETEPKKLAGPVTIN